MWMKPGIRLSHLCKSKPVKRNKTFTDRFLIQINALLTKLTDAWEN